MRKIMLAACAALVLAAAPAFGQGRAADAQGSARTRAEEGLALFKDGRWDDAFAAFAEADRMFHAPTLVAYMGTCRRNQGRLLEARALYEKVLAEPVPPNAPDAFKKAIETARVEIEKLRGRIPSLKVKLAGPGADRATVRVDGAAITAAEIASGKALDPGEHQITAEAPGASGRAQVTLKEGDAPTVEIVLAAAGTPAPVTIAPSRGSMVPAGVAFGVGGAGIVAGTVLGVLTLSKISAAHEGCSEPDANGVRHCPPANEDAASAARGLRVGSGVAFGVGAAGVVAGVVLAIVRPGGGGQDKVGVGVGPGSFSIHGRF